VYHSLHRRSLAAALLLMGLPAFAQQPSAPQPMGTVDTHDALVTGGLEVQGERARLLSNTAVTAYDHTADIALSRGGDILVCATSQFHLLHSGGGKALLFGLDRGAIEIHSPADPQDTLLTPDIRFSVEQAGALDLRLRVTANGDTCVDNAGPGSPVLLLGSAFSNASYRLLPGQHVLFEHGNLTEVVDNERSPCGCPAPTPPRNAAEAQHPFPAAVSEGLAAPAPAQNNVPAGQTHTQVSETLTYGANQPPPPAIAEPTAPPPQPVSPPVSTEPPPTPPGAHDIGHAIARFFHKLFHPASKPTP
jgi:hypothetical protein